MPNKPFAKDNQAGQILRDWWENLEENRGDRAAIKRCRESASVVFIPAYQTLHRNLLGKEDIWMDSLPAIAGLIAHVKTLNNDPLPEQMASGDKPAVSELRFRRLLQADRKELFQYLRRTIKLLNDSANIYSLANSIHYWNDRTKREWAYAYYGKLQK